MTDPLPVPVEMISVLAQHRCGHIARVSAWADEGRRAAQLARIELVAPCPQCAQAGMPVVETIRVQVPVQVQGNQTLHGQARRK